MTRRLDTRNNWVTMMFVCKCRYNCLRKQSVMNDCEEASRLTAYHDGELSPSDRAQFERHLSQCPRCAAELGRIRKLDRKGRRAGLTNLRGVQIESSYFLQYLLPPHSASALHVYFPDPWPKKRHRKNRLINERFPEIACAALMPGGFVYLRTDDEDYFNQMTEVFRTDAKFQKMETPLELAELLTDFEQEFRRRGIKALRAAYQRS